MTTSIVAMPASEGWWAQVMARLVVCLTPRKPPMNLDKSFGSFAGGIQGARQIQCLPMMQYCACFWYLILMDIDLSTAYVTLAVSLIVVDAHLN